MPVQHDYVATKAALESNLSRVWPHASHVSLTGETLGMRQMSFLFAKW